MAQPKKTYLFYDIETSGLNKCFDQVLQFAAIRTDLKLNELERHEIRIQLNPDVIPAPGAIITHRIGIHESQKGDNEYEGIAKIHHLLNKPGTISVGYNTLGFDDEFLRFSFYRNLLTPYTHQYANQCSRMDIYPIAAMYYLFKPEILNWPILNNKITLKLEYLSQSNQLATGQAHDAIVDVEATIALARKFHQERKMWDYVTGYFDKQTDLKRIAELKQGLLVMGKLGANDCFQSPVLSLGQHQHYKNQSLWLRLDQEALQTTKVDSIAETTYVIRKKAGEQELLLPIQERFLKHLSDERKTLMQSNLHWLENNTELLKEIRAYHQHYKYPEVSNVDIDADLYNIGFPSKEEELLFQQFHHAATNEKFKTTTLFPNSARQEQALRILGRNFPNELSQSDKIIFKEYLQISNPKEPEKAPIDFRGEHKLTSTKALAEIDLLFNQEKLDNEQIKLLNELKAYLTA